MAGGRSYAMRHVHLYFSAWQHESRAWRAGGSALEAGLASEITYVGYRVEGLPDRESIGDGQTILRIGGRPARPGSSRLLRALSLPRWWIAAGRTLPSAEISLVTAHSLAALPAGLLVARRSGAPLLYDAHELETERQGWGPVVRYLAKWFERSLIRKCQHTIVVNDAIREWYESAYPGLSVSTVRNVPVIPEVIGPSRLRERLGIPTTSLVYVYCGLLGRGRGLTELIEAFRQVRHDVHLVFIGYGPLESEINDAAGQTPNIHFHPAVAQAELITLLNGADVGVFLPSGKSGSYQNSLPNKVFEYCAAGLALLVSDAPMLKHFASEYPLARSIEPGVESIQRAVESWPAEEIRESRFAMTYQPQSWREEVGKLVEAYAIASSRLAAAHD